MGFSGRFVYSDGRWHDGETTAADLSIDIYDSDIATIDYRSPGASGRFYLGYEPRHYFEDPDANAPVDAAAAADGFVTWADEVAGNRVSARKLARLLASPKGKDPKDDFVEDTVERLLKLVGLPLPDALRISYQVHSQAGPGWQGRNHHCDGNAAAWVGDEHGDTSGVGER